MKYSKKLLKYQIFMVVQWIFFSCSDNVLHYILLRS